MYLFTTSERDNDTVTKINGKYFTKRYGLPTTEITEDQVKVIVWFELNRRGRFTHLITHIEGNLPIMGNKAAQDYLVQNALTNGIH